MMDARGWHTAVIVSDPFHLYRAEIMAHDLGIEAYGSGASNSPAYTAAQYHLNFSRESLTNSY